jgi:hypothetical protein
MICATGPFRRKNTSKSHRLWIFESVLGFLFVVLPIGCGYTVVRTSDSANSHGTFRKTKETFSTELIVERLCATWNGIILIEVNGSIRSRDSVFTLKFNRDATWSLDSDRGSYMGRWSVRTEKVGFYLTLSWDSPEPVFGEYFMGSFGDRALTLQSIMDKPHFNRNEWNLNN